jgi:hypothetical protein
MSDLNLKKVLIPTSSLPGFSAIDGGYTVRYRVVTEDKNQFSQWSPFYFLPVNNEGLSVNLFINDGNYIRTINSNKVLDLLWTDLSGFGIVEYDIFVKINSEDWKYRTTTTNNSANIGLGILTGVVDAKVLVSTPQRIYSPDLILFQTSGPISLA